MRCAALALLLLSAPAGAQLSPADLARAVARPSADARLPAAIAFTDTAGGRVVLGRLAAGRPTVLVFADYTCRHVCGPGLALLGASLEGTGLKADRDYVLVVVGLDPRDGRADAVRMSARLGPLAPAAHILLGDRIATPAAERALGYGTVYDPGSDQWAHDASVYVFGADGRMTALLPELGTTLASLKAALAGAPVRASLGEQIARLCYGLGAGHGVYGRVIARSLQAIAALMLVAFGAFFWRKRPA